MTKRVASASASASILGLQNHSGDQVSGVIWLTY